MATKIKPELSEKNPYYISKERFYELKHFCQQYNEWKNALRNADGYRCESRYRIVDRQRRNDIFREVEFAVVTRDELHQRIEMVEHAAHLADPDLWTYIVKGVSLGVGYDYLKGRKNIPCSRDTYYNRYRRFFCILDKLRG